MAKQRPARTLQFLQKAGMALTAVLKRNGSKKRPQDAMVSTPSLSDTVPPLQSLQASDSQRSEPTFAKRAPPPRATHWSPEVFTAIEWRRFEAVCELLFEQAGFETRMQPRGADGGAEIWLNSRHAEGPVAVVQCKHALGKNVGVTELREFLAVMTSSELKRGTYATTGTFTPSALRFAKDNSINVLDGPNLLNLIYKRTPLQQKALLEAAYEGEYWRPTCARCGIKLVERTPSHSGGMFWGCRNFPTCRTKMPMD